MVFDGSVPLPTQIPNLWPTNKNIQIYCFFLDGTAEKTSNQIIHQIRWANLKREETTNSVQRTLVTNIVQELFTMYGAAMIITVWLSTDHINNLLIIKYAVPVIIKHRLFNYCHGNAVKNLGLMTWRYLKFIRIFRGQNLRDI